MAEIHVERKGTKPWLWLLLALAILLILAWLASRWRDGAPETVGATAGGAVIGATAGNTAGAIGGDTAGTAGAVGRFLTYVEESRARQAAGPNHEYTADGVRRLAAAIAELSRRGSAGADALRAELDAVRAQADSLQRNPRSTEHARLAREAFRAAAALMNTLQQGQYPSLASEVAQVRRAVDDLRVDQPLLEQTTTVQRFFDRSADALRAMSAART